MLLESHFENNYEKNRQEIENVKYNIIYVVSLECAENFFLFSHYHLYERSCSLAVGDIGRARENERRISARERARHACQGNMGTKQTIVFQAEAIPPITMSARYYCRRAITIPCTGTVATWPASSSDVA